MKFEISIETMYTIEASTADIAITQLFSGDRTKKDATIKIKSIDY